jgi:hypothetical protein
VLRRRVGAEERQRAAAGDRADEDDSPARPPEVREERLRHRDLAGDVDLELPAQLVEREELQRHRDRDPGVVDERVELADPLGGACDPAGVGDVEPDLLGPGGRCAVAPDAGEDPPPRRDQAPRARCADSRRGAGHERRPHQSSSQAAILARCSRE